MSNETPGGFAGDRAEAFTLAATSGCCGTATATATTTTCCGTPEAATAADSCCDPTAKADAIADGASCCG
ncbi:hypothetical protein SAMN05421504_112181 [Amycolatopsis xylanica]|uniref:Uncharacterized protein n=1 Tax=Amycolatopsis xylanica TaxID=589385 RepID=A0A1H3S2M5_9PSEU|nr:hypothetical protein [Amycolatopsis xylanica]SDZ32134.1 hypothetical protein SAMN05421504_112181 [Amycolatopsis xylanica]